MTISREAYEKVNAKPGLSEAQRVWESVELAYGHALWYAWGQIDALNQDELIGFDVNDGFAFAAIYRDNTLAFKLEETHSNASLLKQWEDYILARKRKDAPKPASPVQELLAERLKK